MSAVSSLRQLHAWRGALVHLYTQHHSEDYNDGEVPENYDYEVDYEHKPRVSDSLVRCKLLAVGKCTRNARIDEEDADDKRETSKAARGGCLYLDLSHIPKELNKQLR